MKFLSVLGEVNRPEVYLEGSGKIDVVSGSVSLNVGGMAQAELIIPLINFKELEASSPDTEFKIISTLNDQPETLFVGYLSGIGGGGEVGQFYCRASLIHKASILDQVKMSGPGLSPGGISDFAYILNQDAGEFADQSFDINVDGNLAKTIIEDAIVPLLESMIEEGADEFGNALDTATAQKAISYLKSDIEYFGGTPAVALDEGDIEQYLEDALINSPSGKESIWNCLSVVLGSYGLVMICSPGGKLKIGPDLSGLAPNSSNTITPDNIIGFDINSSIVRNISQVQIIDTDSSGVNSDPPGGDDSAISAPSDNVSTVAQYPEESNGGGGILVLQLPAWLQSVYDDVRIGQENNPDAGTIAEDYAKMMFIVNRNQSKNASVVTPIAPLVIPGTTGKFLPYSSAKVVKSGGHPAEPIPALPAFIGYIFAISHTFSAEGQWRTNFNFKNVTTEGRNDFATEHPFYSDGKPFALE
jgi:hypothetical protein